MKTINDRATTVAIECSCLKNKDQGRANFRSHAFTFSFSIISGCLKWSSWNPRRFGTKVFFLKRADSEHFSILELS